MRKVGWITPYAAGLVGIQTKESMPIFLGPSNIAHMQTSHPADYAKYGGRIEDILSAPDYIGLNPTDGSIEYVKEYVIDNEYVKVAVRISGKGTYFARSLYVLNSNRVENFIRKGTLKKY